MSVSAGPIGTKAKVTLTSPTEVTVKVESFSGALGSLIGQLPDYVINIPALPAGLKVNSISVTSQGVVLTAAGQHTTLSQ
jgi:hypothetical protein